MEAISDAGPAGGADLRNKACGVLWNVSVLQANRARMAQPSLGLLSAMVAFMSANIPNNSVDAKKVVEDKPTDEAVMKCCVIMQNLAGAKECHADMISADLALIPALARTIRFGKNEAKQKAFGAVVNLSLSETTQDALGQCKELIVALLTVLKGEACTAGSGATDNRSRACGVLQVRAIDLCLIFA